MKKITNLWNSSLETTYFTLCLSFLHQSFQQFLVQGWCSSTGSEEVFHQWKFCSQGTSFVSYWGGQKCRGSLVDNCNCFISFVYSFLPPTFLLQVSAPAQQQTNATPRQRPQTLDSLFANMKEQRLRVLSQRQNGGGGGAQQQRNGGRQQRPPWGKRPFW